MVEPKSIPSPFAGGKLREYPPPPPYQPPHQPNYGAFSIQLFCMWAGIGRTRAYEEIRSGRLQTKKIGRRTVIPYEAATAWLRAL